MKKGIQHLLRILPLLLALAGCGDEFGAIHPEPDIRLRYVGDYLCTDVTIRYVGPGYSRDSTLSIVKVGLQGERGDTLRLNFANDSRNYHFLLQNDQFESLDTAFAPSLSIVGDSLYSYQQPGLEPVYRIREGFRR
jgi:hypothetical protein